MFWIEGKTFISYTCTYISTGKLLHTCSLNEQLPLKMNFWEMGMECLAKCKNFQAKGQVFIAMNEADDPLPVSQLAPS